MLLLEPRLAVLDETDSGLDVDALKIVAHGVNSLRSPERSMLLVTHYERLLELIVPDRVHVLAGGRIVKSGGKELARELDERGYDWVQTEGDRVSAAIPLIAGVAVARTGADARGAPARARRSRRGGLADAAARAMALHEPRAARGRGLRPRPPARRRRKRSPRRNACSAMRRSAARRGNSCCSTASASTGLGAAPLAGIEIANPEARWTSSRIARSIAQRVSSRRSEHCVLAPTGCGSASPPALASRADSPRVRRLARVPGSPRSHASCIDVGRGARATFVQHFIDCGADSEAGSTASRRSSRRRIPARASIGCSNTRASSAHVAAGGRSRRPAPTSTAGYFDLGGRLVRNDVAITLRGARRAHRAVRLVARWRRPARRRSHRDSLMPRGATAAARTSAASSARAAAASSTARSSSSAAANVSTLARATTTCCSASTPRSTQAGARDLRERREVQPRLDGRRARRGATVLSASRGGLDAAAARAPDHGVRGDACSSKSQTRPARPGRSSASQRAARDAHGAMTVAAARTPGSAALEARISQPCAETSRR